MQTQPILFKTNLRRMRSVVCVHVPKQWRRTNGLDKNDQMGLYGSFKCIAERPLIRGPDGRTDTDAPQKR